MSGPTRSVPHLPALALALLTLTACEVDWEGARLDVETPSSSGGEADTAETVEVEPELPALPDGPLLHAVRVDPDGRAVAVPAARMTRRGPAPLDLPSDPPETWWQLFADSLQAVGTELPLYTTGRRVGTLILDAGREAVNEGCPFAVAGHVLLPPETESPGLAFAWSPVSGESAPRPEPPVRPESTRRLRVFAPILAERILNDAGVENSFLARRAALKAVTFAGDTALGVAATYLINDSLSAGPPSAGPSSSLFFLARFDRSEGYVPVWSRTVTYRDTASKEVLDHLDWLPAREGRIELLRRIDARRVGMAAARTGDGDGGGELSWTSSDRCPVLETLEEADPTAASGPTDGGGAPADGEQGG